MCRGLNQTPAGLVPLSLLLLLLAVGPRATGALLAVPPTRSPACRGGVWGTPPTLLSPDRANRSGGGVQCTTPQAGGGGGGGHAPQARQTILNALLAEVGRTHPDRERVRYLCCCLRTGGAEVKSVEGKFWEQVYPHASNHLNMWYIVGDGTGGSRGGGQHLAGGRVGHQAPHFYCSQIGRVLKKFKLTRSGGDDDDEEVGGGTGTRRGVQNFLFMFPARGVWYTLRMLRRRVRCALVRLDPKDEGVHTRKKNQTVKTQTLPHTHTHQLPPAKRTKTVAQQTPPAAPNGAPGSVQGPCLPPPHFGGGGGT